MKLVIISIYDRVSGLYGGPLLMQNENHAKRAFKAMMKYVSANPNEYPKVIPEDTDLYVLGEFDSETGVITSESPRFLMRFSEEVK